MIDEHIKLAVKMSEYRDTAKRFFGDEFQVKIAPFQENIKKVMERDKCDAIHAILTISKLPHYESDGMIQLLYVSASVELMETPNKES